MDILMYFNTCVEGYLTSDNVRLLPNRIISTNSNNFPLMVTFFPTNTTMEVIAPITAKLTLDDEKHLKCFSPFVKLLDWGNNTFEVFVNVAKNIIFPRPIKQMLFTISNQEVVATISKDTSMRLLIETPTDCKMFTLSEMENPTIRQDNRNGIDYLIIEENSHTLFILKLGKIIEVALKGDFYSYNIDSNIVTVEEINDTVRHLITTTYEFTTQGISSIKQIVDKRLTATDFQKPVALFEAIKWGAMGEVLSYLSSDFADVKLSDLRNYFPLFDVVKVPTVIKSPNTVALINTQAMTLTKVRVVIKDNLITNFEIFS